MCCQLGSAPTRWLADLFFQWDLFVGIFCEYWSTFSPAGEDGFDHQQLNETLIIGEDVQVESSLAGLSLIEDGGRSLLLPRSSLPIGKPILTLGVKMMRTSRKRMSVATFTLCLILAGPTTSQEFRPGNNVLGGNVQCSLFNTKYSSQPPSPPSLNLSFVFKNVAQTSNDHILWKAGSSGLLKRKSLQDR